MRLAHFALAAGVLAMAGCATKNPFADLNLPSVAQARVVAVSLPESLVAGTTVPIVVHWWERTCTDGIYRFDRVQDGARHWTVTVFSVDHPGSGCLPSDEDVAIPDSFMVTVPLSGADRYTIAGFGGSIDFDVTAGIGATGPGHRLLLLDRATSAPLAGTSYAYDDWADGSLTHAMTDSAGVGRANPCGTGYAPMDLIITGSSRGEGALRYRLGNELCGRALRTIMLYGPFPQEALAEAR